jgi:hypothetical protein
LYILTILTFFYNQILFQRLDLATIVFLSPAFFFQLGYISASQDVTVLTVTVLAVFWCKTPFALAAICTTGVLVHELFIFNLGMIFLCHWLRLEEGSTEFILPNAKGKNNGISATWSSTGGLDRLTKLIALRWRWAMPLLIVGAAVFYVLLVGKVGISESDFERVMASHMPDAAYQNGYWSGYDEVSGSILHSAETSRTGLGDLAPKLGYILIPVFYALILAIFSAKYVKKANGYLRSCIFIANLFPLLVVLVGNDFYRWIGMSANISLLFLIFLASLKRLEEQAPFFLLAPFSLLGPIGANPLERPFPLLQFIIERSH